MTLNVFVALNKSFMDLLNPNQVSILIYIAVLPLPARLDDMKVIFKYLKFLNDISLDRNCVKLAHMKI